MSDPEDLVPPGYESRRHYELAQQYDVDVDGRTITINDELVIELCAFVSDLDLDIHPETAEKVDDGIWCLYDDDSDSRIEALLSFVEVDDE